MRTSWRSPPAARRLLYASIAARFWAISIGMCGTNKTRPTEILGRAAVIAVDSKEQAEMESGDLLLARADGIWNGENLVELQEVSGRPDPGAITIFKSNGLAIEDVVAAGWVYESSCQSRRCQ